MHCVNCVTSLSAPQAQSSGNWYRRTGSYLAVKGFYEMLSVYRDHVGREKQARNVIAKKKSSSRELDIYMSTLDLSLLNL